MRFRFVTPARSFASVNGRGLLFRLLEALDDTVPLPEKKRKKQFDVVGTFGENVSLTTFVLMNTARCR